MKVVPLRLSPNDDLRLSLGAWLAHSRLMAPTCTSQLPTAAAP